MLNNMINNNGPSHKPDNHKVEFHQRKRFQQQHNVVYIKCLLILKSGWRCWNRNSSHTRLSIPGNMFTHTPTHCDIICETRRLTPAGSWPSCWPAAQPRRICQEKRRNRGERKQERVRSLRTTCYRSDRQHNERTEEKSVELQAGELTFD